MVSKEAIRDGILIGVTVGIVSPLSAFVARDVVRTYRELSEVQQQYDKLSQQRDNAKAKLTHYMTNCQGERSQTCKETLDSAYSHLVSLMGSE